MLAIQAELGPTARPALTGPTETDSSRAFRHARLALPAVRALRLGLPERDRGAKRIESNELRPWNLRLMDSYTVWDPAGVDYTFERNRDRERKRLVEFEQTMKELDSPAFGPEVIENDTGIPWLGYWRDKLKPTDA